MGGSSIGEITIEAPTENKDTNYILFYGKDEDYTT
ncbi:hypothetical protein BH18THE1_BH18THE1_05010 [soil metagenome]